MTAAAPPHSPAGPASSGSRTESRPWAGGSPFGPPRGPAPRCRPRSRSERRRDRDAPRISPSIAAADRREIALRVARRARQVAAERDAVSTAPPGGGGSLPSVDHAGRPGKMPLDALLQETPCDHHALHLVGALVDLGDLGVAHHALHREV